MASFPNIQLCLLFWPLAVGFVWFPVIHAQICASTAEQRLGTAVGVLQAYLQNTTFYLPQYYQKEAQCAFGKRYDHEHFLTFMKKKRIPVAHDASYLTSIGCTLENFDNTLLQTHADFVLNVLHYMKPASYSILSDTLRTLGITTFNLIYGAHHVTREALDLMDTNIPLILWNSNSSSIPTSVAVDTFDCAQLFSDTVDADVFCYELGMLANKCISNATSFTGALLIVERRSRDHWAMQLDLKLIEHRLLGVLEKIPWVFTYNSWSREYDYMVKAAVRSSLASKNLRRYCVFSGNESSPIHGWLEAHHVKVIKHIPHWADDLWNKVIPFKDKNLKHSHLYASKETVVGTWQRIDIPILADTSQYPYILFTDSDVFFYSVLDRDAFKESLPQAVSMAPEMRDMFPYNAGIMIMNTSHLRLTYPEFLRFILSNNEGMFFSNYGPGDQGAYNQFYENAVRRDVLKKVWNAKPYQLVEEIPLLVHFHGAKPHHYIKYFEQGECPFGNLCKDGWTGDMCKFVFKWKDFAEGQEAYRLNVACNVFTMQKLLCSL